MRAAVKSFGKNMKVSIGTSHAHMRKRCWYRLAKLEGIALLLMLQVTNSPHIQREPEDSVSMRIGKNRMNGLKWVVNKNLVIGA